MRREVLIAIVLGVGLGLAVAFGIWRANLALAPRNAAQTENPLPTPGIEAFSELVLTQPETNTVVTKDSVELKGATNPGSTVAILTGSEEYVLQVDEEGSFEQEVDLAAGPNEVIVTSYDAAGNESLEKLIVVYTTELENQNE